MKMKQAIEFPLSRAGRNALDISLSLILLVSAPAIPSNWIGYMLEKDAREKGTTTIYRNETIKDYAMDFYFELGARAYRYFHKKDK